MWALLVKLLKSEDGQDVIEYALLTAGVGLAGLGTWPLIVDSLGTAYAALDSQTQDLYAPCDPGDFYCH
jgi:Flp pilus assembly pilin Flp